MQSHRNGCLHERDTGTRQQLQPPRGFQVWMEFYTRMDRNDISRNQWTSCYCHQLEKQKRVEIWF